MENFNKDKRIFMAISVLVGLAIGITFFTRSAEPFQIKRVISGTTNSSHLNASNEIATINLTEEGKLGVGDELNMSSSFLMMSHTAPVTDDRQTSDVFGIIDDSTTLLFAREIAANVMTLGWTVVEAVSGMEVISALTPLSDTTYQKNIKLPRAFNLSRTIPLISWRSFRLRTQDDERFLFSARFTANDTLSIRRGELAGGYFNDIAYQVIEFDRDVNVQSGVAVFNTTFANVTVSAFDPNRSFLVFTVSAGNLATPPGSASLVGVEGRYATEGKFIDSTTLQFYRSQAGTGYNLTVPWYLVEFQNQGAAWNASAAMSVNNTNVSLPTPVDLNRTVSFI